MHSNLRLYLLYKENVSNGIWQILPPGLPPSRIVCSTVMVCNSYGAVQFWLRYKIMTRGLGRGGWYFHREIHVNQIDYSSDIHKLCKSFSTVT